MSKQSDCLRFSTSFDADKPAVRKGLSRLAETRAESGYLSSMVLRKAVPAVPMWKQGTRPN